MAGTLILMAVTLFAAVVKTVTGFGPALVVVSLGSLVLGPQPAVVLAALLDLVSGVGLLAIDRHWSADRRVLGLSAAMMMGAVAGGVALGVLRADSFGLILAVFITALGVLMLVRSLPGTEASRPKDPTGPSVWDLPVTLGAGVAGGLFGVGGPLLVFHLSRRLPKTEFRSTLVPVLLAGAIARVAIYGATGLIDGKLLVILAACLPVLPAGLLIGNHLFQRLPERAFTSVVALLVFLGGVRLLF